MARKKKKHICGECGESFNHGIGLRKHQRATQHKGSKIVDEGSEAEAAAKAGAAAPEQAPPEPEPEPEAAPKAKPPSRAAAKKRRGRKKDPEPEPEYDDEENEATVAVNARPDASDQTVAVTRSTAPGGASLEPADYGDTNRFAHNRQKLSVVSRGLRILFAYRARSAGTEIKRKAVTGANVFAEALKLAAALLCLIGIPTLVFFWWNSTRQVQNQPPPPPTSFTFEDGPLAARSALLRYLDHVGKRRWNEAYGLLSADWRQELPQAEFQNSFLDITDLRWAVNDQKLLPDGLAEVSVVLAFTEAGQGQRFLGRFRLVQEGHEWKIDRAELSAEGRH